VDLSAEISRRKAAGRRPRIDWYAAPDGDLEWNGGLVRHGYLTLLAREYRRTREERFARTVVEHLLDYIEGVPPFDPEGKPYLDYKRSTWRPFEVAGRAAETWPEALVAVIGSPAMTPRAWAVVLLSIHEQAGFLRRHHWRTGNHAALEAAGLGIIGVFFRELREAASWREYAAAFLEGMWPRLFHEDGYSREMSGGYHWVAVRSFFAFYEVAERNGFASLFSGAYRRNLEQAALAELYQQKPDYSTPVTNDSNSRTNHRRPLERVQARLPLPPIAFRLSGGREGRAAEPASHFFPSARVGIMRGDWSEQALYLFFDMGRWGDNHMNEDQLHVEVSAFGRNLLAGCGRWRYTTSDPSAPWMPWARYFKTTAAYNSVLVDGWSQMPGDADGWMTIGGRCDYAEGRFAAGYGEEGPAAGEGPLKETGLTTTRLLRLGGVIHTRKVFFLKPHFWLLRDEIDLGGVREGGGEGGPGTGPGRRHAAAQIWHYPEGELAEVRRHCYSTRFPDANLLIAGLGAAEMDSGWLKGRESPIAGWHCPGYDRRHPAPELRFEQGGTDRIAFHTLIAPYRGPEPPEVPELEALDDGYRVRHWAGVFTVLTPDDGAWSLPP
jgi:hypothetical protein